MDLGLIEQCRVMHIDVRLRYPSKAFGHHKYAIPQCPLLHMYQVQQFPHFFFLTAGSSKQAQLPSGPPRPNRSKEGWSSGVSTPQSQGLEHLKIPLKLSPL